MKTNNWQTKALTLFIAVVVALWLATACDDAGTDENAINYEYFDNYEYDGSNASLPRITPSGPCGYEDKATSSEMNPIIRTEMRLGRDSVVTERYRIRKILDKYEDMIFRHSTVHGWSIGELRYKNGERIDQIFIEIEVENYFDLSTLPPEDQIPECLEGVPVHFVITPIATIY